MNKLEQAIRKADSQDSYFSTALSSVDSSITENIVKMENGDPLDHKALENKKIIFPAMKNKKLLNSFRDLRTALTIDPSKNIVMITSICNKAGTSFFARNIAAATAFDVSKTAIIFDCNPEKNNVSETFDMKDKAGIINYILDPKIEAEHIIHNTGIKRLRAIPFGIGSEDVGEHLCHPRFQDLLSQIKHKYTDRYIFVDAPPITESADARILMELCDQVVLLVPYGKVNIENIEAATKIIGKEKFSGVVFNDYIK